MTVQPGLSRIWSEPKLFVLSRTGSNVNVSYSISNVETNRPYAAPQSREGTKSPLGTATPYVQHANRKKNIKKRLNVFKLKVPMEVRKDRGYN